MRHWIYFILVVLVILPGNLFTRDENTKRRQYNSADNLQSMSEYDKAIPILKELVKSEPENANYNFKLGFALVESYSAESAIPYLEVACKSLSLNYRSSYKETNAPIIALEYLSKEYFYEYEFEEAQKSFYRLLDYIPEKASKKDEILIYIYNCKSAIELMKNPINVKLSDFSEAGSAVPVSHSPLFSPDESFILFTCDVSEKTSKSGVKQHFYNDDIYYSKFINGEWKKAEMLSSNISTTRNEASVGIHPNGKQLLIFRDDNGDGNLYYSDLIDKDIWSKPKKFPGPINSDYYESHATISAKGDIIYFTSNRPGGFGGLDIYMSKKDLEGKWGPAVNMGAQVNSSYNEESPHLQANKNILYFSSDRAGGMGGFDIYRSTLEKDSIVKSVLNIGYPINTPRNDLFFKTSLDGNKGYFSSSCKEAKGALGLNIVTFNENNPNVFVKGIVISEKKDTLNNLKVYLFSIAERNIIDSSLTDDGWGYYNFNLYTEKKYFVSLEYEGYMYYTKPFAIDKYFSNFTFTNTIELDPINLSDSSFRQNIGEFIKLRKSLATNAEIDSSINIFASIDEENINSLSVTNNKLGTIADKSKPVEPEDKVVVIKEPEVVKEPEIIPDPVEIVPEIKPEVVATKTVVRVKPRPVIKTVRDWRQIADSLKNSGLVFLDDKDPDAAIDVFEKAMKMYNDHDDEEGVIFCMNHLAIAYNNKGEYYDVIDYDKKIASFYDSIDNTQELGNKYNEIGDAYSNLYNKENALDYYNKSLLIKKDLNDTVGEENVINDMAGLFFKNNDFDSSIYYFNRLIELNDDLKEKASTLNRIGLSYHNLQEYITAVSYFERAIDMASKAKDDSGMSIYLNNEGNSFFDSEDYDKALSLYNQSLDIKRKINYIEGIALSLHNIGNTYLKMNDYESSVRYYNESLEIAEKNQFTDIIISNHFAFSQLYELTEEYDKALFHFQEYIRYVNPMLARNGKLQLAEQSLKYDVDQSTISGLRTMMHRHALFAELEKNKKERELELLKQQNETQMMFRYLLLGILGSTIVLLFLLILRFRTKRKTYRHLSLINAEILHKNEEILNQRRNLELVNKELEKLSIVASETDNAVAIIDKDFNFEWINKGYTKLFGISIDELNIAKTGSLIESTKDESTKALISECISRKVHISFETLKQCKNGVMIWTQTSLTPILVDGEIYKIISIDSDINELKKAETEIKLQRDEIEKQRDVIENQRDIALNQKNEIESKKNELEHTIEQLHNTQKKLVESEKMASLGNLVAGVAHEINTPVGIGIAASTTLITKTKMIIELFETKKMKQTDLVSYLVNSKDAARLIQSNLQRTGELVKSFKRISVDEMAELKRTFNLEQYIKEVIKSLEPKLKEKICKVKIDCSKDIVLNSYPGAFAQILTNYIVNTIIHGFRDKEGGNISIIGRVINAQLFLQYKDDGNGMSEEVVKKVFNPFFTTNMQTGTGLGMNIVYNIVTQKLNGEITCESKEGEGVIFTINVPVDNSEIHVDSIDSEHKDSL